MGGYQGITPMKKFKTLRELREYNNEKSKRSHQRRMEDPLRAEAYRIRRRKYEKQRRREYMQELRQNESQE